MISAETNSNQAESQFPLLVRRTDERQDELLLEIFRHRRREEATIVVEEERSVWNDMDVYIKWTLTIDDRWINVCAEIERQSDFLL